MAEKSKNGFYLLDDHNYAYACAERYKKKQHVIFLVVISNI